MKKIISYVLLLAMALALFAGCAPKADNSGLESAKTYLYNMYKDTNGSVTAVSYTRVGVVTIQGVGTYTVDWTVNSDAITVTRNDKMVSITIPDYPEAEIAYTLTATIKDDKGNSVTVSFNYTVPAAAGQPATLADGTYVIISGEVTMSSLAESNGYGYPTGNKVTVTDGKVTGHKAADVLTIKNVDGGVTIQDAYGRYFYLKGTYNSFNVDATAPAEGHIWEVLKNSDGLMLVNTMNKKTLAYSTSYSSWGAYAELTDDHCSALAIVAATAPEGGDSTETPVTPGNDPAADSTLTVEQVIALGGSKEHNTYTTNKYYVTGVITEVYNETYGNMKIKDDKGNILTIYGTYDATGDKRYDAMATKPGVGDTVTIYGIVGQYNNTPQVKNGWITAHTPAGSTPDSGNSGSTSVNPGSYAPMGGVKPVAGTGYKFAMYQGQTSTALYFTGKMDGYYLATSSKESDAVKVYVEETTGGLYIYFMDGSAKKYLDIVPRGGEGNEGKVSVKIADAPSAVFTWNESMKMLTASLEGKTWCWGTYNIYTTINASETRHFEDVSKVGVSQHMCEFLP